jgi:hypothetical protein
VTLAGLARSQEISRLQATVLQQSWFPYAVAFTQTAAANEIAKEAVAIQKDHALAGWLAYQARSRLGTSTKVNAQGVTEVGTNLTRLPGEVGRLVPNDVPGVITVDCYFGTGYGIHAYIGYLPGLSKAMLKQLDGKFIKDLKLPIIYRVVSRGTHGMGWRTPAGRAIAVEDQFAIRVNETGETWADMTKLFPGHRQALARLASGKPTDTHWYTTDEYADNDVFRGLQLIPQQLGWYTLGMLHVDADKD